MKKNLVLLTGIVFVLTILLTGGCNTSDKKKGEEPSGNGSMAMAPPPNHVDVFLKDQIIGGEMHLFISDSKRPECGVIDDHLLVVKGGETIKWKNALGSNIDKILNIRVVGKDTTFFGESPEVEPETIGTEGSFRMGTYKLSIPDEPPTDTLLKYEIIFTTEGRTDTTTIDPYLKVPKRE